MALGRSGSAEDVTVAELIITVAHVAGTQIETKYIDGPVGVQSRNFRNTRIESLGWKARSSLRNGIERTYPWVYEQAQTSTEPVAGSSPGSRGRSGDRRVHPIVDPFTRQTAQRASGSVASRGPACLETTSMTH
jgi:hypothetical protein